MECAQTSEALINATVRQDTVELIVKSHRAVVHHVLMVEPVPMSDHLINVHVPLDILEQIVKLHHVILSYVIMVVSRFSILDLRQHVLVHVQLVSVVTIVK